MKSTAPRNFENFLRLQSASKHEFTGITSPTAQKSLAMREVSRFTTPEKNLPTVPVEANGVDITQETF